MSRVLVVGQAPARASEEAGYVALDPRSRSGRRLARYAGLDPEEMHRRADFVNLLPAYAGPDGWHGDAFDRELAEVNARGMVWDLLSRDSDRDTVVLLGRNVADAFARALDLRPLARALPWFEPVTVAERVTFYSSPHPSGVSQFWNDPHARAAGEAFWRSVLDNERTE